MMTIPDETLLANAKKLLEKYNLAIVA